MSPVAKVAAISSIALVGLTVWLVILTRNYNERTRVFNRVYKDTKLERDLLKKDADNAFMRLGALTASYEHIETKLETLESKTEIIDESIHGNVKRKARMVKAVAAIKEMLPRGGNPLPGCPKAPSPGELWSIAGAIIDNADYYAVPPSLIAAVIRQESAFCNTALSHAGAKGYMQLMPDTAAAVSADVAVKTGRALRTWRGRDNIQLGTAYLSEMLMEFGGDQKLAVAAYNAGPNHVKKWLAKERKNLFDETADYYPAVLSFREEFEKLGLH